jgi:hypothetical protein
MAVGASCDPTTLAASARCFNCLNPDDLDAIMTQLFCNFANSGGGAGSLFAILTETGEPILTETGEELTYL